jgi:hypothetical protein
MMMRRRAIGYGLVLGLLSGWAIGAFAQTVSLTEKTGGAVFLSVHNNAVPMTDIGTTYTQVTAFDTSLVASASFPLFTVDAGHDTITIVRAGMYLVGFQISFSGTANSTFECAVFKNTNTEMDAAEFRRKLGAAGDVGSASGIGIFMLAATDTIMLKCHGDTAGDDMLPTNVQVALARIG